jgi:hypothetical protein
MGDWAVLSSMLGDQIVLLGGPLGYLAIFNNCPPLS